jgi:benzoyl-CoA reductase subunit C
MGALEAFHQVVVERHSYAREWKARTGQKAIGYLCTYVPEEILYAAGILPVRVLGGREVQDMTDRHIYSGIWCAYCRDVLGQGLAGRYEYLDGLVNSYVCDHIRGAYESWVIHLKPSFYWEVIVPNALHRPHAATWLLSQIRRFKKALEDWIGHSVTDDDLWQAIETNNVNRLLLREFHEMKKADYPPLTGAETAEVTLASLCMDKKEHSVLLQDLKGELAGRQNPREPSVRIMLVGSECYDMEFYGFLESLGATVVSDTLCTGMRSFWEPTPVNGGDPMEAIVQRLVNRPPCPIRDLANPGRRNIQLIVDHVKEYRAQAVIFLQQKFCDVWCYELPALREACQEMDIPLLHLEQDVVTPAGQFRTRVEAMLETLTLGIL